MANIPGLSQRTAQAQNFLGKYGMDSPIGQAAAARVKQAEVAESRPAEVAQVILKDTVREAVSAQMFGNPTPTLDQLIKDTSKFLVEKGVAPATINQLVTETAVKTAQQIKENQQGPGLFGNLVDVGLAIGTALPTGGMSVPETIAYYAVVNAAQGAKVEDIIKSAVAAAAAQSIPQTEVIKGLKQVSNTTLQSSIDNALTQAIYAAGTGQNVGQNVLAGAAGGAAADLAKNLSTDKAFQRAVGEFTKYASLPGFSFETAAAAAAGGYLEEVAQGASAKKQKTAGLPTGQVMAAGGGVGAETDVEAPELIPSRLVGQPAQRTPGGEEAGTLPPVEVVGDVETIPGLDLIRRVRTGEQAQAPERILPEVEVIGQREPEEEETETQRLIRAEEMPEDETPETQRQPTESIILDLISGGTAAQRTARQQRAPDDRELASMQALSQALRIGDPGEPLFGGRLGRRRNVWNVESLRLKDELGG